MEDFDMSDDIPESFVHLGSSGDQAPDISGLFKDGRFSELQRQAKNLNLLSHRLNEIVKDKTEGLLGEAPSLPEDTEKKERPPGGWLGEVLKEVASAIDICNDSIKKISSV